MKTHKHTRQLKTLFLTSALALTTLLGSGQSAPKNQSGTQNSKNRSEQSVKQTQGIPPELIQIVPAQKNTLGASYITVNIKNALNIDLDPNTEIDDMDVTQFHAEGQLMARIYVDPVKDETRIEYLNKYGPFYPSQDPSSPIYKKRLDDALLSISNRINVFLTENAPLINHQIEHEGLVEINYANQSITTCVDDNSYMIVNLKDNKITFGAEFDNINFFYRTTKNSQILDMDRMSTQDKNNAIAGVKRVLEIGAQTGNNPSSTYRWKP